jgi:peptidyl-prolyl cis-trans isomerase B (cyclophilin B)
MNKINATITFTNGKKINLELYPDVAPLSVARFVELAKAKFYDGVCFHRVIEDFMIQGGGMVASGGALQQKSSGLPCIKGEFKSNGVVNTLSHTKGVLSMARTNVANSATSQFFICVADADYLDGNYAAFGKVADDDSLKVAVDFSLVPTCNMGGHGDVPRQPIVIERLEVREK